MRVLNYQAYKFLGLFLLFTELASAQVSPNPQLRAEERLFTASKIYSFLQLYFSGWKTLAELNPEIAYRNYLEEALATEDRRQFDLATLKFVARLKNGHTLFQDSWLTHNYGQPVGLYARPVEQKWVVVDSANPNIRPGDILSKIDDIQIETFFRQQRKYISGSSEAAQSHNLFLLPYLFPLRFTVTLDNGRRVNVDRSGNKPGAMNPPPEGRLLTQGIVAYIRISSFATPLFEEQGGWPRFEFTCTSNETGAPSFRVVCERVGIIGLNSTSKGTV